jgi:hypothetical protein
VGGGLGQATQCFDQRFTGEISGFLYGFANHQFGQGGTTCHRWNAAFRPEAHVADSTGRYLRGETEDVAAGRVLNLDRRVGVVDFARVARVLKMVQDLSGIHLPYCNRPLIVHFWFNRLSRFNGKAV